MQDGEVWTFSVRSTETSLPDQIIHVNYDGFAEGIHMLVFFLESTYLSEVFVAKLLPSMSVIVMFLALVIYQNPTQMLKLAMNYLWMVGWPGLR